MQLFALYFMIQVIKNLLMKFFDDLCLLAIDARLHFPDWYHYWH
jgi:hypothetical protein